MLRGGKGNLHLLQGDDGTGWGGLNAHKAGVQGDQPSFQQRTAFLGTSGFQARCTGLRQVLLTVLPFLLCLGSPKLSLVLLHDAGTCTGVFIWGRFEVLLKMRCLQNVESNILSVGGFKPRRVHLLQSPSTASPAFAGENRIELYSPFAPVSNACSPKMEQR